MFAVLATNTFLTHTHTHPFQAAHLLHPPLGQITTALLWRWKKKERFFSHSNWQVGVSTMEVFFYQESITAFKTRLQRGANTHCKSTQVCVFYFQGPHIMNKDARWMKSPDNKMNINMSDSTVDKLRRFLPELQAFFLNPSLCFPQRRNSSTWQDLGFTQN